jgi:hypothetical protein
MNCHKIMKKHVKTFVYTSIIFASLLHNALADTGEITFSFEGDSEQQTIVKALVSNFALTSMEMSINANYPISQEPNFPVFKLNELDGYKYRNDPMSVVIIDFLKEKIECTGSEIVWGKNNNYVVSTSFEQAKLKCNVKELKK